MIESVFLLLIIGFAIVIAFGIQYAKKAREKRLAEMFALSQALGLEFLPTGLAEPPKSGFFASLGAMFGPTQDKVFIQRFQSFQPFGQGHSQDIENLMVGHLNGIDWYLFDYSYKVTTHNGKTVQTSTHYNAIVAARLPMTLPDLDMRQETVFHRIGNKLGMQELTFELEEFNRRYYIRSGDPKGAHDLLHPKAIEFLMTHPMRHWQMRQFYVMLTQPGRVSAAEFQAMFQEVREFLDLVPPFYRQDHGFTPSWQSPFD